MPREVRVDILVRLVACRHVVPRAAFLVQSEPEALSLREIVLNVHANDGANVSEAEDYDPDERLVTEAGDGVCLDIID